MTVGSTEPSRAWSFMALSGAERQFAGNEGYDDEPEEYYSWDSTVPNHAGPAVGDVCVLRDRRGVLGVSRIERMDAPRSGLKVRRRCPVCGTTGFKARRGLIPRYRCGACGAEFDSATEETVAVLAYRAEYASGWVSVDGAVTAAAIDPLYRSGARQHAIRELDVTGLSSVLASRHVLMNDSLRVGAWPIAAGPAGGRRRTTAWGRVGQDPFRRCLLERFGTLCVISGPQPVQALQAAHLQQYADDPRHDVAGGLLMRADLHLLFDARLINVGPDLRVSVSELLAPYAEIQRFHGRLLQIDPSDPYLQRTREYLGARLKRARGH
jgi:ribosomal protein S27AE